jgi:hypothetical protein
MTTKSTVGRVLKPRALRLRFLAVVAAALGALCYSAPAQADFVVTDGRFTNIYVYPDPDRETWNDHIKSLRPDSNAFTVEAIDAATRTLMAPGWPSYFGALYQYGGINPPAFFGSAPVSQSCIDAAMRSLDHGVMNKSTIRTLSNCHADGMDPSPQVNLIFSPDITVGEDGPDLCTPKADGSHDAAYHNWGLNTPNFAVVPTSMECQRSFDAFTQALAHEVVEMLSDPGQAGHGSWGGGELGDQCENPPFTNWNGVSVQTYRSDNDNICWPALFPVGSVTTTWVLGQGHPLRRLTGDVHTLDLAVPAARIVSDAAATQVQIWIQTGDDDLRGGDHARDNADVTLRFAAGSTVTTNVNGGREWGNGQTHGAILNLPPGLRVQDITGVTISTLFGGGIDGDNWNVDRVALLVSYPVGSRTWPTQDIPVVSEWLNVSGNPLIRFTGDNHDLSVPVPGIDVGVYASSLRLIVGTGNDDLRGGSHAQDNCDVTVELEGGQLITLKNVNRNGTWPGWSTREVAIPLPPQGLRGGQIRELRLHTGFGGGIDGDNWNVNQLRLEATLVPTTPPPTPTPIPLVAPAGCTVAGAGGSCGTVEFTCNPFSAVDTIAVSSSPIGVKVTGTAPNVGIVVGDYYGEGKSTVRLCAVRNGSSACGDAIANVAFGPMVCPKPPPPDDHCPTGEAICRGVCRPFNSPGCIFQ